MTRAEICVDDALVRPNLVWSVLEALDVTPDMPIEEIEAHARALLERVRNPEALIFTDVFGATPCNVAQRLADGTPAAGQGRRGRQRADAVALAELRATSRSTRWSRAPWPAAPRA